VALAFPEATRHQQRTFLCERFDDTSTTTTKKDLSFRD
jgi:hypothetical protein